MSTKTRFEEEAKGNLETAYCLKEIRLSTHVYLQCFLNKMLYIPAILHIGAKCNAQKACFKTWRDRRDLDLLQ